MERLYTVLLDRGVKRPIRHYRGNPGEDRRLGLSASEMAEPPHPVLHRERLTAQELQELMQEPDFVAAAEIMRTRLLSPIADGVRVENVTALGTRRQSWGISAVGADRSKFSGADVTVAMLDTGIDATHPAFRGIHLVQKDFTGSGNGDSEGHGTHCAGIFFGRNVGGVRIGVAPGVRKALIGKVLERDSGDSDMLIRGLAWAHEQGAHVISMSVGLDFAATVEVRRRQGWSGELAMAVTLEAYRANLLLLDRLLEMLQLQEPFTGGAIVVAAAGNDSSRGADGEFIMSARPPSGSDRIVSVGSLDPDASGEGYRVSDFSNSGVEIAAPGRAISSAALGGGLKTLSGTSVAAPHVAGVAALWWQAVRQSGLPANATVVRSKLLGGAQSKGFSPSVYAAERGAGRACAPHDGLAVATNGSADRDAHPPGDIGWESESPRALPGRDFEPISIGFRSVPVASPGGRRLC